MSHDKSEEPSLKGNLADMQDGDRSVIVRNNDRKSAEMGLFAGTRVTMFRNRKSERSLVIGADEARFLITRAIASQIEVAAAPDEHKGKR